MDIVSNLLLIILYFSTYGVFGNDETCNCYMLGTLSSIQGESICNNLTLQCRCYKNIIGKNCDQCKDGFYDILSGRGCNKCNCDSLGSHNKSCNAVTGQCLCKDGFIGLRCDECDWNRYHSLEQCSSCNCNIYGSTDLTCNELGQCSCLKNLEGNQCDTCKENTYDIKQGCIPCPSCYNFVQNSIRNLTRYVNNIEESIEQIENNIPQHTQDYKHFLNEVKLLKAKINKLKMDLDSFLKANNSYDYLNNVIQKSDEFHSNVTNLLENFKDEYNYKEINLILQNGTLALKQSKELLNTCNEALANATMISKTLNRHNKTITNLAESAVAKSKKIEDKADDLEELSNNVTTACKEACDVATTFNKNQELLKVDLMKLNKEISDVQTGVGAIAKYLKDFNRKTKATKDEANRLNILADDLVIPTSDGFERDIKTLKEDYDVVNQELKDLAEKAYEVEEMQENVTVYLNGVEAKQKDVNEKMELLLLYEERTLNVTKLINEIIANAQDDYAKLKEYEQITSDIQKLLNELPEIQAIIDEVNNNSENAKFLLEDMADTVRDVNNLERKIDATIKVMIAYDNMYKNNLKKLEQLEEQQRQLSLHLEKYHANLKDITESLKLSQKYENDMLLNIAKMEEYIVFLNMLPLSDDELNEIEKEILIMEEMMDTIDYLSAEKVKLEKEVENVKDILESIPIDDKTLCESAKSEPKLEEKPSTI